MSAHKKKVVLFEHDGGELANQLWNYVSVYAYALERGYTCENWSFFEYPDYFARRQEGRLSQLVFVPWFRGFAKRRGAFRRRTARKLYKLGVVNVVHMLSRRILYSTAAKKDVYHLPPTEEPEERLVALERTRGPIYLAQVSGTVFRNPAGLTKYRDQVVQAFRPAEPLAVRVEEIMRPLRAQYSHVVGVHVRQGDYKGFKGGKYVIPHARVREILEEYIRERGLTTEQVCFFIASDSPIEESLFAHLNIVVSKGTAGEDLFTLAACDAVVGSDSTFGHFAAWYGNVPHVVMKNDPIDWAYYRDKKEFFWNKYLTVMQV